LNEGLEGWLRESLAKQKGNILIHTKIIIADFTSDQPIVISGSHNLSGNASASNDENFQILHCAAGNTHVADCYGVEVMRIYDHYRFRWFLAQAAKAKSAKLKIPVLDVTDGWTDPYFGGDAMSTADRQRFGP